MHEFLRLLSSLVAALTPLPAAAWPTAIDNPRQLPAIPSAEDAPIAYMVDLASGQVLYARDADRRFMPASITKVMTTFLAFEWMEEGRLFPQQVFSVRPDTFQKWNRVGSTMFLPHDARVSVDDLVHGVTTVSANDGAVVLAEGAAGSVEDWLTAMNAKALDIGMHDSHFATPNGWMDQGQTFTTANDLVTLGRAMISRHPSKYHHFVGATQFEYNGIRQQNHDPIAGVVPGADGIKTGFTNQSGFGFLGSAERNGRRLVMVVAGSPTGRARNASAKRFIEWGFSGFETHHLFRRGARIATARVQGGGVGRVGLRAHGPVQFSIPRGIDPTMTLTVRYAGPLRAPIKVGEEVAELVVAVDGMPEHRVPLVAETEVFEATLLQRVFNGIGGWLP